LLCSKSSSRVGVVRDFNFAIDRFCALFSSAELRECTKLCVQPADISMLHILIDATLTLSTD